MQTSRDENTSLLRNGQKSGHEYFLAVARKFLDPASQFRLLAKHCSGIPNARNPAYAGLRVCCGPKGIRIPDLVNANDALYQLSYGPVERIIRNSQKRESAASAGVLFALCLCGISGLVVHEYV